MKESLIIAPMLTATIGPHTINTNVRRTLAGKLKPLNLNLWSIT